jgi:rod shape-determining protein MreD
MKTAAVIAALVLALALQTTIAGLRVGGLTAVNLVLVVVVYAGLALGPAGGLVAGTAGGLMQDALAGGIIGIGGFSKTLVGFLVGVLGAQFIVSQPVPRFVMFVGATILHEAVFQALYALVESHTLRIAWSAVLIQAVINGVIGVLAFQLIERGPQAVQRRRARGASLGRRDYS